MRYIILNKCGLVFYLIFFGLYKSILSLFAYGQLEMLRWRGHHIGNRVRLGRHAQLHVVPGGRISIGEGSCIEDYSVIVVEKGGTLTIGSECYLSRNLFLGCANSITIGNHVAIGGYVTIIDANKNYEDTLRLIIDQGHKTLPIAIEDDVWIGGNATLLAGTTIGKHSVVAACSLVRGVVEANSVIAGVPSKIIRRIGRNV